MTAQVKVVNVQQKQLFHHVQLLLILKITLLSINQPLTKKKGMCRPLHVARES